VRGATCAALVVALWPFTVWETKVTVPENLLVLLIPLAFLGLKRSAALAGAAAAWSALTHGVYPVLALFVVLMLIVMKRFRAAAIAAIVIAIPLACWTARNAHLGFRGLATGYGYHYFRGLYDYQQHDLRDHNIEEQDYVSQITVAAGLPSMATDDARSDPTVNKWLDRKATEHLLAHPGLTIVKTLTNMPKAWIRQQTTARSVANALLLLPLLILAAIGLRRDRTLWPIALAIVMITAAASAVSIDAIPMRYALPMMPLLAILAGSGCEVTRLRGFGVLRRDARSRSQGRHAGSV